MLAGRPPFAAESHEELVAKALALNYTLDDVLSLGARQLIDSMLQVLPSDRASVQELAHDPWTTADAPMPPEADCVCVDLERSTTNGSPTAASSRCATARRTALYVGYALLVGGALLFGASRELGAAQDGEPLLVDGAS